jgi:acyl-CoA reductase-like NAD-dependent aldehyde dehydrogenase
MNGDSPFPGTPRPGHAANDPTRPSGSVPLATAGPAPLRGGRLGQHPDVDSAVAAAQQSFTVYHSLSLQQREEIIANIRRRLLEKVADLARQAVAETGLGRVDHKIAKNRLVITKTPGLEILTPEAFSGDHGLTLMEYAPFGVIAAITPVTNPSETVINNSIGMLVGGNTVVFNAHPSAKRVTAETIHLVNQAVREAGCPVDVLHACQQPSITTAQELMQHRAVRLLVVTGGPGVVRAAMNSGKKVIAAGAGNPPVVVDATAELPSAAQHIVAGASLDNNIVCIAEKVCIAEQTIHDQLVTEMVHQGCHLLSPAELERVEAQIFSEIRGPDRPGVMNRKWVGKDARHILRASRVSVQGDPPLALALVPAEHPLVWTEQMLPVLPVVAAPDVEAAIEMAVRFEQGNQHTAMMHSRNVEMLSLMAQRINTSIFVKNGSCAAGLGGGGEGYTSYTIASPTGEGLTTARSFCRRRRCVLVGAFRIV